MVERQRLVVKMVDGFIPKKLAVQLKRDGMELIGNNEDGAFIFEHFGKVKPVIESPETLYNETRNRIKKAFGDYVCFGRFGRA